MPVNKSTNGKPTCKAKDTPEGVKREPKRPHEVEEQPAKQSTRHAMINNIDPKQNTLYSQVMNCLYAISTVTLLITLKIFLYRSKFSNHWANSAQDVTVPLTVGISHENLPI